MAGRELRLSNLDKVLWPEAGFTKGAMIDYYHRIAEVMLPHLRARPITLRRYPNGVDAPSFFEKNCPKHRPPWVETVHLGEIDYCAMEEPASLVWVANLAAIELHPSLACAPELSKPRAVVFDLDPGEPADVVTCGKVALLIKNVLDHMQLRSWVKTSGSKGLQVYIATDGDVDFDFTRRWSLQIARLMQSASGDLVVTSQEKTLRKGKVLIDWSQNVQSKTTVAVYSVRARKRPTVSTPVTWDEVRSMVDSGDPLTFEADEVLDRVEAHGDLFADLLTTKQKLPALAG